MEFKDKYISTSENTVNPDSKKTVLSDDAYSIGEQIELLVNELRQGRFR